MLHDANGNGTGNGNGQSSAIATSLAGLPPWMIAIRQAVTGAIKAGDLEAIFAKQIELAKAGDRKAAKFVLDQAARFSEPPKIGQIIQNNFYGADSAPDRPTTARPGSAGKIERMQRRAAMGIAVTSEEDGPE